MKSAIRIASILLVAVSAAHAADRTSAARIASNGAITFGDLTFSIVHFNSDWQMSSQQSDLKDAKVLRDVADGATRISGRFATQGGNFELAQTVLPATASRTEYEAVLSSESGVQTNTLALALTLPVDSFESRELRVDAQAIRLPQKLDQQTIFSKSGVKRLEIPTIDGSGRLSIEGPLSFMVQDDRKFGSENYTLRISFEPAAGLIKRSTLKLAFTYAVVGPPVDRSLTIVESPEWRPLEQKLDIEPGSILDLSSLVEAPAGKYGNVVVKGAHFEFANRPGKPVRFYGCNLCFSANYPSKEQAEKLAERLSRIGYNCVRLHHYDADLVDRSAASSATLNPAQLDKLDYLVHCLKQKGLYVNIDLYTIRQIKPAEIPELNRPVYLDEFKAVVPLLDSAMANWQAFARNLLTHRNPYTGLTWAEDPVLVGICPLNEDPLVGTWSRAPDIRKLYEQKFEQYLKDANITPTDNAQRSAHMTRFLVQTQIKANEKAFAFLRSIGAKAPLTSVNCIDSIALTPIRAREEYVDNHAYWDHPGFPVRQWGLPHSYSNRSAIADGARVPRTMMPTRIIGKPFTCTEFDYCFPNRWRAEGGPLIGAYAALQDWDGLYRFAYSHNIGNVFKVSPAGGFDLVTQPLDLLSERIAILMFLRGDVSPATALLPYLVTDQNACSGGAGWGRGYFPESFSCLGLRMRIGCFDDIRALGPWGGPIVKSEADAAGIAAANGVDVKRKYAVSETGQIAIAGDEGTFRVVTDRSECFVMPDAREMHGRVVGVAGQGGFCVVSVASMDGKPVKTSSRLLVIHLTDMQNTGIRYRDKSMKLMEQWGQLPHLVRAGKAKVRIEFEGPAKPTAWAIDLSGKRREAVELQRDGDAMTLIADTARPAGACMCYEIVRQ